MTTQRLRWRLICLLILGAASFAAPAQAASWWERLLGGDTDASEPVREDEPRSGEVTDIAGGLREALLVGSERVVARLSAADGFNGSPDVRVLLPPELKVARDWLGRIGADGVLDDLETRLNRAAEAAAPEARTLFVDAIKSMTIRDARDIFTGGDTAATQYLKGQMEAPLVARLTPLIQANLAEVGAVRVLDSAVARYEQIPFAPKLDLDLNGHVAAGTVAGMFKRLGEEEQAIRRDPAQRTTELLRGLFGS